jgi:uncharacterized tellurite resistance protein B-like protein
MTSAPEMAYSLGCRAEEWHLNGASAPEVVVARREDSNQAARHYQRALDIDQRLGQQARIAASVSQLGTCRRTLWSDRR